MDRHRELLDGRQARGDVQSVRRAIALLKSFNRERLELGVNELAREHGLHPSSVSRLLATLADGGFVRVNPVTGKYRPGFASLELAGLLLLQLDVHAEAQPIMRELAGEAQETVNLAVRDGLEAVVIEQAAVPNMIRYVSWVGRRVPLHASAHGKVLMAFQPTSSRAELIAAQADSRGNLPRFTETTVASGVALEEQLAIVRGRGYSTSLGELHPELSGVAVPIFDHSGAVVGSLSISGPTYRYRPERVIELGQLAVAAGRRLSRSLGWEARTFAGVGNRAGSAS